MQGAVEFYQNPFLADFPLPDSEVFEEWVQLIETQLHQKAIYLGRA
jgi:hypothetical protein